MASIYSVSQINAYLRNMFEQDFLLRRVTVRGEISNCKYHPSGHIYFTLKDEEGTLSAVMFASRRRLLKFQLENGQQVLITGSIQIYEAAGKVQLYADSAALDGVGDLHARFMQLKTKLEEMGMFAEEYKKPIPAYVKTVGIVTADTGAAIRDIINIASRRNPSVQLILCPAQVQGEGAALSIANGIARLDALGLDCLIVGRGGGSMEDLWAFNEEIVAEAIFNCHTPVVSAVGHETDFTIADFVADLRAPTPSAAAELVIFEARKVLDQLADYEERLDADMEGILYDWKNALKKAHLTLLLHSPESRLEQIRQTMAKQELRLQNAMKEKLTSGKHALAMMAQRLERLSPLSHFRGGYAFVSDAAGHPVKEALSLEEGAKIRVCLEDGYALTEVLETSVY
ncbi:MAG: exodeoxyribonuclease VII large subunit [Lachnospiraceae bacterium]|nr:exodeoxyribonuclease VII large subunit [Lachnospiraceae bacterium]